MNNIGDSEQEMIYRSDDLRAMSNEELESILNAYGPRVDRRFRTFNRVCFSYFSAMAICFVAAISSGDREVIDNTMQTLANLSTYGLTGMLWGVLYLKSGSRAYESSLVKFIDGMLEQRNREKREF